MVVIADSRKILVIAALLIWGASAAAQTLGGSEQAPRMDSDMRKVLDMLTMLGARPVEQLSVEEARRQPTAADAAKAVAAEEAETQPADVERRDVTYDGATGSLRARIYTPRQRGLALSDPLPLIVYFHGGGWVIATVDTYDGSATALAAATPAIVVSFEYRRAPENQLPAAHEDAFAAYRWALRNAANIGAAPGRIALTGESAGGNLAAYVARRAREEGIAGARHLALIYPVASAETSLPSYSIHADAKPMSRAGMEWFFSKAIGTDEARQVVDLLKADLSGLPATTIINAEIDPLLSDGQELATALRRANVDVRHRKYDGVTHEFFGMTGAVGDAKSAQEFLTTRLRESLEKPKSDINSPVRR